MKRRGRSSGLVNNPPPHNGMTSREVWLHERELERKVDNHQRFWRRVAFLQYLPSDKRVDVLHFRLLDTHRQTIGRAKWTRSVAYSIAAEHGWKIIT